MLVITSGKKEKTPTLEKTFYLVIALQQFTKMDE